MIGALWPVPMPGGLRLRPFATTFGLYPGGFDRECFPIDQTPIIIIVGEPADGGAAPATMNAVIS